MVLRQKVKALLQHPVTVRARHPTNRQLKVNPPIATIQISDLAGFLVVEGSASLATGSTDGLLAPSLEDNPRGFRITKASFESSEDSKTREAIRIRQPFDLLHQKS